MRKVLGLMAMVLLAVVLVACNDDEDATDEATEVATEAAVSTEVEELATEVADDVDADETEVAEAPDLGTPIGTTDEGTPIVAATPGAMATPASEASPLAEVVASPVADGDAGAAAAAGAAGAAGATASGETMTLAGQFLLEGNENETYVIAEEGCVGLGEYANLRAGRQVVVRDQGGSIIGVTELEAGEPTQSCSWGFSVDVPESEFYAVSIPMVVEQVFSSDEVEDGDVTVPLR